MESESLSEKCSQPPLLEFEGFVIRPFDGWRVWMENPDGEGTSINKVVFLAWLRRLFEKHF